MVADSMNRREFGKVMSLGLGTTLAGLSACSAGSSTPGNQPAPRNPFDVERARRDTPGVRRVLHLNNAGAALPPTPVLQAVQEHLDLEAAIGPYEAAEARAVELKRTYQAVARLIGCSTEEIALVENATRGWDMAFYSLDFKQGDRILTSHAEYASNYIAYQQVAGRTGAVIEVLPNDEHGQVSVDALEGALKQGRVALVGLTHIPSNGGLVNPVEAVGRLTRAAGVPFLLDACQAAGQWPLDVARIGCDMLAVTGRKFLRGPRGTGFLYVRRGLIPSLEPPLLDLHAAAVVPRGGYEIHPTARRFENWERNVAATIGLGAAVDYALGWGIEAIRERVTLLAHALRAALAEIPGITVRDLGREKCGIVTFTVEGLPPGAVQEELRTQRINVYTVGARGTPIDMEARGLSSLVRASVHYYNDQDELARVIDAIRQLVGKPA